MAQNPTPDLAQVQAGLEEAQKEALGRLLESYANSNLIDNQTPEHVTAYREEGYAYVKNRLYVETIIAEMEKRGWDSTAPSDRTDEVGNKVSAAEALKEQFLEEAGKREDTFLRNEYTKAFPDSDPEYVKNTNLGVLYRKWEQAADADPSLPRPARISAAQTYQIRNEVAKEWAAAQGLDGQAIENQVESQLRSVSAGGESLLTAPQRNQLLVAALNVQYSDRVAGDKAYEEHEHLPSLSKFYVADTAKQAAEQFEQLRQRQPQIFQNVKNPFLTEGDITKPMVYQWQDQAGNVHSAVFLSRDWANRNAGRLAKEKVDYITNLDSVEAMGLATSIELSRQCIAEQDKKVQEIALKKAEEEKKNPTKVYSLEEQERLNEEEREAIKGTQKGASIGNPAMEAALKVALSGPISTKTVASPHSYNQNDVVQGLTSAGPVSSGKRSV